MLGKDAGIKGPLPDNVILNNNAYLNVKIIKPNIPFEEQKTHGFCVGVDYGQSKGFQADPLYANIKYGLNIYWTSTRSNHHIYCRNK